MLLVDPSVSAPRCTKAFQGYVLFALAVAIPVTGRSLASGLGRDDRRLGAVCLGLAGAVTTNFMAIAGLYYFSTGVGYALPFIPPW